MLAAIAPGQLDYVGEITMPEPSVSIDAVRQAITDYRKAWKLLAKMYDPKRASPWRFKVALDRFCIGADIIRDWGNEHYRHLPPNLAYKRPWEAKEMVLQSMRDRRALTNTEFATVALAHGELGALENWLASSAASPLREPGNISEQPSAIEIVSGGFRLQGGDITQLTGKPLAMLREILKSRHRRVSTDAIRTALWPDTCLTAPEQAVKDTASKLRKALIKALRGRGVQKPGDPLPHSGRGTDLTYTLDLSALNNRHQ